MYLRFAGHPTLLLDDLDLQCVPARLHLDESSAPSAAICRRSSASSSEGSWTR